MKRNAVFIDRVNSAFVLSGYGQGEWENHRRNWQRQPDLVAENLLEAVQSIIGTDTRKMSLPREAGS